jgi:FtsZ-binding cell division protein ZapB
MDALAQTATTQLLTVEIEGLKLEIQSLRVDLQESQERCQWLDEEASLLLNVERLHHETDDDYKKRKVSIYNKRAYKREKQRGSAEEENKMLIAQLETLRGELIQSEDKI